MHAGDTSWVIAECSKNIAKTLSITTTKFASANDSDGVFAWMTTKN